MAIINGLDTNDQSNRDQLRSQGYYIDNTGVYSPGGNGSGNGQRVGDTWSGGSSSRNEAPNNVFLPLKNGTPLSPSSARTGGTNYAAGTVGLDDPNFASYFGPGSYFFQQGGPNNYGWMGSAGSTNSPAAFLQAIQNYGQMANQGSQGFAQHLMGPSNVSSPLVPSMPGFQPQGGVSTPDYLMMLRQMYPGVQGIGALTGGVH